jgi:predicted hydrocarbon binding protein
MNVKAGFFVLALVLLAPLLCFSEGMAEDQVVKRLIDLMEYCKVGTITLGETIQMKENCESFGLKTGEPSCNFTTGFLNGFFSYQE